jgi:hypothetical protein
MASQPASPTATTSGQPEKPVTQGRVNRLRRGMATWIQELPTLRFPSQPDANFQLIDRTKLDTALAQADSGVRQRIDGDLAFLETEVMRLFRERDHEAKMHQNRYRLYQLAYIFMAALAGMIGSIQAIALSHSPNALPFWAFLETVIALLVTYLATISGREPPLPLWLTNRRRAEQFRREYFRYLMNMPPYDELEGYQRQTELSKRVANINRGVYPDEPSSLQ